jgi:plastocyanin
MNRRYRLGMPVRRSTSLIASAVAAAALLAGCSNAEAPSNRTPQDGSASASTVDGVQQITVKAGDDFRFAPDTITVHPGSVHVVLVNTGKGAPHDWLLSGMPSDFVPLAAAGQTKETTFTAPAPGSYRFVCTIHENQGQTGTLVVLAK